MGYKYRNGDTPDHVDSSDSNSTAQDDHGLSGGGGDPKPKIPMSALSDSVRKYDGKMKDAADKGDVAGTRDAAKKYAGFEGQYAKGGLDEDLKNAQANKDSANKYGAYQASIQGKLKPASGMMYGAETSDTSEVINRAKQNAAKKKP